MQISTISSSDSLPTVPTSAASVGAAVAKIKQSAATSSESSSRGTRRPRGSGNEGLLSRAAEFRSQASDLRKQASSETGHRADNLNARADRADAAADRLEAAAGRSSSDDTAPGATEDASPSAEDVKPPSRPVKASGNQDQAASRRAAPVAPPVQPVPMHTTAFMAQEDDADSIMPLPTARKSTSPKSAGRMKTPLRAADDDMSRPVARASAPSGTGGRSEAVDVSGDTISMKATAGKVSGNWKSKNISGRDVMVWDAKESNYEKPQDGQSISFDMKVPKSGTYTINLDSARVRSVMGAGEKYIKHAGNDAFVKVTDMDTGEVVLKPEKLFTFFGDTDEKFNVGDEFSKGHNTRSAVVNLDAGGNYKFEVIGRSDGYALNEVKLKRKS